MEVNLFFFFRGGRKNDNKIYVIQLNEKTHVFKKSL